MQGEADAADLSAAALALLECGIAPGLTGPLRIKALMAVSALKMADRERRFADRLAMAARAVLLAGDAATPDALKMRLRALQPDLDETLWRALLADSAVRTAVTRPKALGDDEWSIADVPRE